MFYDQENDCIKGYESDIIYLKREMLAFLKSSIRFIFFYLFISSIYQKNRDLVCIMLNLRMKILTKVKTNLINYEHKL